jgi:hypothetical protein
MASDKWRIIDPPRPLSGPEQATLAVLLAELFRGCAALRRQADIARVKEECTCGCGSIALVVDHDPKIRADVSERIPVEGRSTVPAEDGAAVEVLLHVVDGYMNELEIVPYTESVHFPDPQTLTVWIKNSDGR